MDVACNGPYRTNSLLFADTQLDTSERRWSRRVGPTGSGSTAAAASAVHSAPARPGLQPAAERAALGATLAARQGRACGRAEWLYRRLPISQSQCSRWGAANVRQGPAHVALHTYAYVSFFVSRIHFTGTCLTHVTAQHAPGMRPNIPLPLQRFRRCLSTWLRHQKRKHRLARVAHRLDKGAISLRLSDAQDQAVRQAVTTVEEIFEEEWVIATSRSAAVGRQGVLKAAEITLTAHGVGGMETSSSSSSRVPQEACRTHQQVECGITRTQKARLVDHSRKKA